MKHIRDKIRFQKSEDAPVVRVIYDGITRGTIRRLGDDKTITYCDELLGQIPVHPEFYAMDILSYWNQPENAKLYERFEKQLAQAFGENDEQE